MENNLDKGIEIEGSTVKDAIKEALKIYNISRDEIDIKRLDSRFRETAAYDVSEASVNKNLEYFLKILNKKGLLNER